MHTFRRLIHAALLTAASHAALAGIVTDWTATHSLGVGHAAAGIATDDAGNSYIIATIEPVAGDTDIAVARVDASGALGWRRTFAGPGGQDLAHRVLLSPDGTSVYVVGRSNVPNQSSNYTVLKYDAGDGTLLWSRFHNGPGGSTDDPRDAAVTPDGGIAVTGGVWNGGQRLDFGTVKYDAAGNLLWTANFSGPGRFLFNDDRGDAVAVTPEGDVVVTGFSNPGIGGSDVLVFKYAGETGAVLWSAAYSTGANETPVDLCIAPNGDAVVLGLDPAGVDRRWFVARFDGATGAPRWTSLHDPGSDEAPRALAIDHDGNVFAVGSTDPDADDGNFNEDLVVFAFEAESGALVWDTRIGGIGYNEADLGHAVAVRGDDVWVAGSSRSAPFVTTTLDAAAVLLRLDRVTGVVTDEVSIDSTETGGPTRTDSFEWLGFDDGGHLIAGGRSSGDVGVPQRTLLARFSLGTCIADFNQDGGVDGQDVETFFLAWEAADSSADLNRDGGVDGGDVEAFFHAWEAGC